MTSGYLIRPIALDDSNGMFELSRLAGAGFTSLQPDRAFIQELIEKSIASFQHPQPDSSQTFMLVLVHLGTEDLVGCASVKTGIGHNQFMCADFELRNAQGETVLADERYDILRLKRTLQGMTEVGSLFLHPDHRSSGVGRFLARSRYLLMASNPQVFGHSVVAQLRGYSDQYDRAPFFDAVWAPRLGLTYEESDVLLARDGAAFLLQQFDDLQLDLKDLPRAASDAIGVPHPTAAGALKLLQQEGFRLSSLVDLADGGPIVMAEPDEIASINDLASISLTEGRSASYGTIAMLARLSFRTFRAFVGGMRLRDESTVECDPMAIQLLDAGSMARIVHCPRNLDAKKCPAPTIKPTKNKENTHV